MKKFENIDSLLVVVDVINGFIHEGNMRDGYIYHIVEGIETLVKQYIDDKRKEVFFIKDSHSREALEFKKFPIHCLENTSECEMVKELKEYEDKVRVYKKNSTSAIFAKGLLDDIDKMTNLKRVCVVGCCSDICVLNFAIPLTNYFDELNKDVEVSVIENLIETYDAPYHNRKEYNDMTIKLLKQAGIKVIGGNGNE